MIGNPGSGKSHLSIGLGLRAIKEGFNVKFYTAATLATTLVEAREFKSLGKLEKQIQKADLLILDELSYLSFNRTNPNFYSKSYQTARKRQVSLLQQIFPFLSGQGCLKTLQWSLLWWIGSLSVLMS
jgi:DNA replication protein DnaC